MSQPALFTPGESRHADETKKSFLDLSSELRNKVYEMATEDFRGNWIEHLSQILDLDLQDCIQLQHYQNKLSHVSRQIRAEWQSFFETESVIVIDYDARANINGWLETFGALRLPAMETIHFKTDEYEVYILLDDIDYSVVVNGKEHSYRTEDGKSSYVSGTKRQYRHTEYGIRVALEEGLRVKDDGYLYIDTTTLFRIMHGLELGFESPEYKYLYEQPSGHRAELPSTWQSHVEVARVLAEQKGVDLDHHALPIEFILASMAKAGGPEQEGLPLDLSEEVHQQASENNARQLASRRRYEENRYRSRGRGGMRGRGRQGRARRDA